MTKAYLRFKTKGHDFLMFISKTNDGWEHANQMTNQKEHRCLLFWSGEGNEDLLPKLTYKHSKIIHTNIYVSLYNTLCMHRSLGCSQVDMLPILTRIIANLVKVRRSHI